jgi:hypothetical protein
MLTTGLQFITTPVILVFDIARGECQQVTRSVHLEPLAILVNALSLSVLVFYPTSIKLSI